MGRLLVSGIGFQQNGSNAGSGALVGNASTMSASGHVTNTPADVQSATLFAWYDFSLQSGAGGSSITTVPDQSGNARDLTCPVGHKPTVTANWNATGRKAGTSTATEYAQSAAIGSPPAISAGVIVFCAGQFTDQTTTRGIWDISSPSDTQCFVTSPDQVHFTCNSDISGTSTAVASPCEMDGTYSSTGANPTNNILNVNGTQVLNGSSGSSGSTLNQITLLSQDALTIGGATIGEWFCFAGLTLSAVEYTAMRSYLKIKWGTP